MKLQAAMMNHHLQSTCIFVIRKYDLHPVRPPKALYPNLGGLHHTAAYLRRFCRGGSSPVGPVTFQTIQITEVGTAALPVKLCLLCLLRGELGGWREEASKLVILGWFDRFLRAPNVEAHPKFIVALSILKWNLVKKRDWPSVLADHQRYTCIYTHDICI